MKGQASEGNAKDGGKMESSPSTISKTVGINNEISTIDTRDCNVLALRAALFNEDGTDKNVTSDIAPSFMKYDRNGLDLSIQFSTDLVGFEVDWAFKLVKEAMEDKYEASGYGWDDDDKMRELTEKGARFLLVRQGHDKNGQNNRNLVAFVHFRFTVQGEVIDKMGGERTLFVYDMHVEENYRRKGLSKHLLIILELIARKQQMLSISVPVQLNDSLARDWISGIRGFQLDKSLEKLGFDAEMEGIEIFSKSLPLPQKTKHTKSVQIDKKNTDVAVAAPVSAAHPTADKDTAASDTASKSKSAVPDNAGVNGEDKLDQSGELDDSWVCVDANNLN